MFKWRHCKTMQTYILIIFLFTWAESSSEFFRCIDWEFRSPKYFKWPTTANQKLTYLGSKSADDDSLMLVKNQDRKINTNTDTTYRIIDLLSELYMVLVSTIAIKITSLNFKMKALLLPCKQLKAQVSSSDCNDREFR